MAAAWNGKHGRSTLLGKEQFCYTKMSPERVSLDKRGSLSTVRIHSSSRRHLHALSKLDVKCSVLTRQGKLENAVESGQRATCVRKDGLLSGR